MDCGGDLLYCVAAVHANVGPLSRRHLDAPSSITGNGALSQHRYNGNVAFLRKKANFDFLPPVIETLNRFSILSTARSSSGEHTPRRGH